MTSFSGPSAPLPDGSPAAVVVGGGPAGLMAAEVLARGGAAVALYDAMPSVGRKFLLAGVGGMNLTHSEPFTTFTTRYGQRTAEVGDWLRDFDAEALRAWAQALGIATFVGSSGRVFPADMKAAPLLRAWLHRLRESGVVLHRRHRFTGWSTDGELCFESPAGVIKRRADVVVLALGGGSWPRLGSDGAWLPWLQARGVAVAPLQPANCGFEADWSAHFRERFAGAPLKAIAATLADAHEPAVARRGEAVISATGIEGSLVYALSSALRAQIAAQGQATLLLDLAPDRSRAALAAALARPRGKESLSNHLRKRAGLEGVKVALLREVAGAEVFSDPGCLAAFIKQLPLTLTTPRPLAEAISSAGGVCFDSLERDLMLKALPGVFCAGEMLDWEAPTGGYLLTACMASGRRAGQGALAWLRHRRETDKAAP